MTTKQKLKLTAAAGPIVLMIATIILGLLYMIFKLAGLVYGLLIVTGIVLFYVWMFFSVQYLADWLTGRLTIDKRKD